MAFNNYLEDENDKPYFNLNSLAYYYDKMEGFAEKVEGSAKALNLTKEEVEKRLTLYIQQNKNELDQRLAQDKTELDQRLAQWDGKLETFDSSVETLLTEWVDDGTLNNIIDSTLIDQKIAPVAAQLAETSLQANAQTDFVRLLQESNEVANDFYVMVTGQRSFDVAIPFNKDKFAHFCFVKDMNDDFIKMGNINVSSLGQTEVSSFMNYDDTTGSFNTNGAPNYYANPSSVGATFFFNFDGTGFDFQHRADAAGGMWEFVVDGDSAKAVQISTHINASSGPASIKPVFTNLENKHHTVVATFIGDDPNNLPSGGAGTSRGWVSFNNGSDPGRETIKTYKQVSNLVEDFRITTGSNKEFAFSHALTNDNGATFGASYWIPEHNGIGTAFLGNQRVLFDGKEISDWTVTNELMKVKSVKIIQSLDAKHPEAPSETSAQTFTVTTITAKGVAINAKFKALRKLFIEGGHVLMLIADNSFVEELVTSYGTRYPATLKDGSKHDLTEDDTAHSYAFINKTGSQNKKDIVLAVTHNNLARTLRWGKPNRKPDGVLWLQHRATLQKLYPHVMRNHVMEAGEEYELSGIYFLGELPMANEILPNY